MANSLNVCSFTGNLGQDPQFNVTNTGTPVASFSLAVNNWNSSKKAEETMWLRVTLFQQKAEFAEKYAHKGSKVAVSGQLRVRQYNDRDNVPRTSVELIANTFEILSSNGGSGTSQGTSSGSTDDFDPFLDSDDLP